MGSLTSCMLEGDFTRLQRARNIRHRALAISISLQTIFVAGLILFPLLSKGERIDLKNVTPIPPYAPYGHPRHNRNTNHHSTTAPCSFCPTLHLSPITPTHDPQRKDDPGDPNIPPGNPQGQRNGILFSSNNAPTRPDDVTDPSPPIKTPRVTISQLQPAMLSHRVEPLYPAIPKAMHREGRVELRAIIATDGSIQSLEAISGDPMFFQSAFAAVREWRYKATILNGQPVEVDTRITVIYSLPH
ncbi:MAG: TonB family protein, partial [Acidobacteriota bacterium]|nr:TonB family protein [Acidobacteriota bacterium]